MKIDIQHRPSYALAVCHLDAGDQIRAEGGAMVSMSANMKMETSSKAGKKGGILKGLKRLLAGESFFMNLFTAENGLAEVTLAPKMAGDIQMLDVQPGEEWVIQATSYLASGPDVEIDTKFGGFKSFFSGERAFWIKASGHGPLIINSFGGVHKIPVQGQFTVDTGHIVAFQNTLTYKIRKAGNMFSLFFGGEGLVCEFNGHGDLYIQTRNASAFGQLVGKMLPPR
ncbi:MAG: TIGR00266 family protein [Myxococcales bacterium]|nr:TIGR00266 family protein [Myxococcales bacterium]